MDQLRLHVFEIDALNRLLNVQIPLRAGCRIGSVPIERPVSRVAILLDFDQQIARTYGMSTAGRKENGIACLNSNSVNVIDHGSLAKSLLKAVARDAAHEIQGKARRPDPRRPRTKTRSLARLPVCWQHFQADAPAATAFLAHREF